MKRFLSMSLVAVLGVGLLVGCADPITNTNSKQPNIETLTPKPLPDLVVDQADLAAGWHLMPLLPSADGTTWAGSTFAGDSCTATEGGFGGYTGNRTFKLLGFNVLTINIGDAPLHLGLVANLAAIGYDKTLALTQPMIDLSKSGYVEFSPCSAHNHWHYRNYSKYELIKLNANGSYGATLRGRKQGYCMYDTVGTYAGGSPKLYPQSPSCGFQGLSPGWGDNYWAELGGQSFILNDPNDPSNPNAPGQLQAGNYILRVTVNPPFFPMPGEICPVRTSTGECHMFAEKDYNNNIADTIVPLSAADVAPWPTTTQGMDKLVPGEMSVNKGMRRW